MSYDSVIDDLSPVGRWKLDESSGNAIDSIGGNDGTIGTGMTQGGEPLVPGGASVRGTGVSGGQITAASEVTAYPYTMAVWFKTTATTDAILSLGSTSVDDYAYLRIASGGSFNLLIKSGGASTNVSPPNGSEGNNGDWHLGVAVMESDTSRKVYLDAGEAGGSTSNKAFPSAGPLEFLIGARSGTSLGLELDGIMSEALLFDKALTASEVRSIFLAGRPPSTYSCTLSSSAVDSSIVNGVARIGTSAFDASINAAIVAASNGSNVWFSTDSAGLNDIASKAIYESGSVIAFDVAVPSMSASSDTTIYLHIGSVPGGYSNDPYPASAEGIYPLAEDFDDDSSSGNDGSGNGGIAAGSLTGPDGSVPATDFDGIGDYIALSSLAATASTSSWTFALWADPDTYDTSYAFRVVGDNSKAIQANKDTSGGVQFIDGKHGVTLSELGGDRSGDGWYHIAVSYDATDFRLYINGVEEDSESAAPVAATYGNVTLSNVSDHYDGGLSGFSAYSSTRSAAEIKLDYLLQGPNASTYWTVTSVSPLPDPTFELRSDQDVVLSGSDVTSWGNASGGTSPTYSTAAADKVLGFPAIQFDRSSSEYLEWNEIASMFSGDDPDWTAAILYRPESESGAKTILGVDSDTAGADSEILRLTGTPATISNRDDGTTSKSATVVTSPSYGTPYLTLLKSESGTLSYLTVLTDGTVVQSNTNDFSAVGSIAMVRGAIGARAKPSPDNFYEGDVFRIRLYNQALDGDLTGDLTGTQLEVLKNEMLRQAGSGFFSRLKYGVGLRLGWRL